MGVLGHPPYLFILPYSAGIFWVNRAGLYPSRLNNDHPSAADTPTPSGISQEPHVGRVVGKGLVVGGNHRCAATARGRGERGKADELGAEVCARSRNKAIPWSRVQESESSRSEPLDQEVKTKLILKLVTGSEVHRWAGTSETK